MGLSVAIGVGQGGRADEDDGEGIRESVELTESHKAAQKVSREGNRECSGE